MMLLGTGDVSRHQGGYCGGGPSNERTHLRVDLGELVGTLNRIIRGWRAYFALGNSTKKLVDLDRYVWLRLWRFLKKRQGARGRLSPAAFAEWERRSGLAYFYPMGRRGSTLHVVG